MHRYIISIINIKENVMTQRRCGECGSVVADTATQCKRCGMHLFPAKNNKRFRLLLLI